MKSRRLQPLKATLVQEADFSIKHLDTNPEDKIKIVDENNRPLLDENFLPVGASKHEVIENKLWHRCNRILVMDELGNFYVQKRANGDGMFPGYFDLMSGGYVTLGDESDRISAQKALMNQYGIISPLTEVTTIQYIHDQDGSEDVELRSFINIFIAKIDSST